MENQRAASRAVVAALVTLLVAMVVSGAYGAEQPPESKSSVLRELTPPPSPGFERDDDRHVFPAEERLVRRRDEQDRELRVIYFPPNPPPLGVELSLRAVDARAGAPPELAVHVLEPFYAPLSTRLIERSLTPKQESRLAAYVERRSTLLRELRVRLSEVANVGPDLRLLALEEFAARQAPSLAALEREADELRLQCYTQPLSSASGSWYEWRGWKLGRGRLELPRDATLFLESQLLRGAAFYQAGLSPEQRELAREAAIELESVVFPDERAMAGPSVHEWFWFFSPHLARVHLPDDLPPELQERMAEFRQEKAALKNELRDTIYEQDRAVFASSREAPLASLAAAHAPRLAELERMAEEIRRELVRVAPLPVPPAPPALPGELAAMIDEYDREKRALERDLAETVRRAVRHMHVPQDYGREKSVLTWNAARLEAMDRARTRWREENAERLDALKARLVAVRAAVEAWVGPDMNDSSRSGSGSFLREFFARRSEQQGRYECHLAVFEPGLSPPQRRLLFRAGIAAMNLPLPGPEEQPTALPGTLLK